MRLSRSESAEAKPRRRSKPKQPLAAHPLFVPTLTAWGAAFAGLAVFVLPGPMVAQYAPASLLGLLGGSASVALPVIAAMIGAAVLYLIASAMRRAAVGEAGDATDSEPYAVQAIDPGAELGSHSLDAPLESAGLEDDLAVDDEGEAGFDDYAEDELDPAWVEELELAAEDDPSEPSQPPEAEHELDLAAFAEREPAPAETVRMKTQSAIEKLRSVPPQELSLVQMVERFALALHEKKANGPAQRDAALAHALKTLSQFTADGFQGEMPGARPVDDGEVSEVEMREALAKLQSLRGAA